MWVWGLKYHNSQKDPHFEESTTLPMDVLRKITVATGHSYMYYQITAYNLLIYTGSTFVHYHTHNSHFYGLVAQLKYPCS